MPYFVFRISPYAMPEQLAEFDAFRDASRHAKTLRIATLPDAPGPARIKVMFAGNAQVAEELLCQVREAGLVGDD